MTSLRLQDVYEINSVNWPNDQMTCSISISNESTDTSTALDDTRRSSSIPFQSRDKGCVTCAFFRGISCLVISGDDILGDQLCFYKIMVLLSIGLMELNLLSVCFLLCLCQENSVSNVGNLLLWDFFLIFVASFSYSLGELDDNFEKEGDKEPLFFFAPHRESLWHSFHCCKHIFRWSSCCLPL